jgi:hypothetical protein
MAIFLLVWIIAVEMAYNRIRAGIVGLSINEREITHDKYHISFQLNGINR